MKHLLPPPTRKSSAPYFDRDTTNVIKGIALIMMFAHHFFTFPEWWIDGISYPFLEKLAPYFCAPLKLCVPIFAFLTGYFYCFAQRKTYRYSLRKITDVLITYWVVYFLFALVAAVFLHYPYTFKAILKESFALTRPTMYFCWYVYFYISLMLLLPLIAKVLARDIHLDLIITFGVFPFTARLINHFVKTDMINEVVGSLNSWLPLVLLGFVFANYDLFAKIEKLNKTLVQTKWLNTSLYLLAIMLAPLGRYVEPGFSICFSRIPSLYISFDVLYTPIFIYCVVNLLKTCKHSRTLSLPLQWIGKYSLLMWFLHCIFFNNSKTIFQPILYAPRNPILVLLWGLILCLALAILLDLGIKKMQSIKNKLLFKEPRE